MLRGSLKSKNNNFELLQQKIKQLAKEEVRAGYFGQSRHSTAKMTYQELITIHESGLTTRAGNRVVARPVRKIALVRGLDRQKLKVALDKWSNNFTKPRANNLLLSAIGFEMRRLLAFVIGNPQVLFVTSNPTPLLDTGELKANLAYKTSLNKRQRKLGKQ